MNVMQHVLITPDGIIVNGQRLSTEQRDAELLREIYRKQIGNYPKFFKMDPLCKLGFIASELLLAQEGGREWDEKGTVREEMGREDRAVILFNRSGSLCDDRDFQRTIDASDGYFPSPSVFVYTLPNIVTGEIAIRNRYYGETDFYVLPSKDEHVMQQIVADALDEGVARSALCGWLECEADDSFEADLYLIGK